MASTSVHLPPELVMQLDALAASRRTSRNRIVVEACQRILDETGGEWPPGFFSCEDLSQEDLEELRTGTEDMMKAVQVGRRTKRSPPF